MKAILSIFIRQRKNARSKWGETMDKRDINEMENILTIVLTIMKERDRKGLKQSEIAKMAGISNGTLARMEAGNFNVSFKAVLRVLSVLDFKIKLIGESPNPDPPSKAVLLKDIKLTAQDD